MNPTKILQEILKFINEYPGNRNARTEIMSRITRALRYEQQVHYGVAVRGKKKDTYRIVSLQPSLSLMLFLNKFSNKGETCVCAKS